MGFDPMRLFLFSLLLCNGYLSFAQTDYRPIFRELGEIQQLADGEEAAARYVALFERIDYIPSSYLRRMERQAKRVGDKEAARRYAAAAEQWREPKDAAYAAELNAMLEEDQRVRSNKYGRAARRVHGSPPTDTRRYRKAVTLYQEWVAVDSANVERLLHLVATRGFPSERLVGTRAYHYAYIIFVHYDRDSLNQVLQPIFDTTLQRGNLIPYDYAYVLDRHISFSGTASQTYCSSPNSATETAAVLEACNVKRAELGLPPRAPLRGGKLVVRPSRE